MKSRFGQIDRQAAVPPLAGLMLAVSAAAGGMYAISFWVIQIFWAVLGGCTFIFS